MNLQAQIEARAITEVLHFTTSNGLVGIMSAGYLFSHAGLPNERQLSYILQVNCPDRSRDREWHDYVNLSISRVNSSFFRIAQHKWHATKDLYWCVLSFDTEILTHEGVLFTTTNNAYEATRRELGVEGFEAMFAPAIQQFPNKVIRRERSLSSNLTTCSQAEVLYPRNVSIRHLRRVYVPSEEIYYEAEAQISVCAPALSESFELVIDPAQFG